jgi:hypothetical protein
MLRHKTAGVFVGLLLVFSQAPVPPVVPDTLPAALTDREFWELSERISEPDGFFRSNSGSPDNLLSNENMVATVAAQLQARVKSGGVYLGVGPEQNFTYIAAMRPKIAFITDIRRGNLHLHLLYKALFEMSPNRVEFVGRLFTRTRPPGLTDKSSAADLMRAYLGASPGDEAVFKANLKAVTDHLTKIRRFPLNADDGAGVEYVHRNFHEFGPGIYYTSSIGGRPGSAVTYAALMAATDTTRTERGFLASEENFAIVKTLQSKNLIVPVVGDFAGPKALRSIGGFLKHHNAVVTAFYLSNVEMYLQRNGVWLAFCGNVASLPLDATSRFIRPSGGGETFGAMAAETARCGR